MLVLKAILNVNNNNILVNDIPHEQKSKNEFLLNQAAGKAAILHNGDMATALLYYNCALC